MFVFYENKSADFSSVFGSKLEFSAHLHGHIELVYMLEGRSGAILDGEKDTICAGDVFIAFPNQVHQYQKIGPEKYLIFIFSPDILPDVRDIFMNYVPVSAVIKNAAANERLLQLLHAAAEANETASPYREIKIKGYLLAFFGELFPMMALKPVKTSGLSNLKRILNYCSENYTAELSLDVLSKDLHISKYHISYLFGKKLHMGFNEYINGLRISKACRYLLEGGYNVTEIAFMVGFNSTRNFNRAFYRQMGTTPREYKAKKIPAQR